MQKVIKSCYLIMVFSTCQQNKPNKGGYFYEEEIIKHTSCNSHGCYNACRMWIQWGQQATTPATDNKTETSAEAKTETSAEAKTETSGATGGGKVGVAMPTKDPQRWNQDGSNMQAQLEAAGYDVDRSTHLTIFPHRYPRSRI